MRATCWRSLCAFVVTSLSLSWSAGEAQALPQFKKQFDLKYVKADSQDEQDKAFAAAVKKANCNVCHVKGKTDRKLRNPYGEALSGLLDHKLDKDNAVKIQKALDDVAAMKKDAGDPNSPTWGDILNEKKLPVEQ